MEPEESVEPEPVPNVRRIAELSAERPDEVAYVHLAMDGSEISVTWSELHRRSFQAACYEAA